MAVKKNMVPIHPSDLKVGDEVGYEALTKDLRVEFRYARVKNVERLTLHRWRYTLDDKQGPRYASSRDSIFRVVERP